jgi:hypothetical protein
MLVISIKRITRAHVLLGALKLPDATTRDAVELRYISCCLVDLLKDHLNSKPRVNSTL